MIKKVENSMPLTYVINDLNGEQIVGIFCEKGLQKANQKEFREKVINYMSNGKDTTIPLIVG